MIEKRHTINTDDKFIWRNKPTIPTATARSFYLDNKDKIDELVESIKWTAEEPKSDHGYYSGIDKVGNKYRRYPCGQKYSAKPADGLVRAYGYSAKEALIMAIL